MYVVYIIELTLKSETFSEMVHCDPATNLHMYLRFRSDRRSIITRDSHRMGISPLDYLITDLQLRVSMISSLDMFQG